MAASLNYSLKYSDGGDLQRDIISVGKVCVGYSESKECESIEDEQQIISGTKTQF